MGNIKPLKKDLASMVALLDTEEDVTVEDLAGRAFDLAFEVYEQRAKFSVVGQIVRRNGTKLDLSDPVATPKISLGNYTSETTARTAAMGLFWSPGTGEQARMWVLPAFHGTPSKWYQQRKQTARLEAVEARLTGALIADMDRQLNEMSRSPEWGPVEEDEDDE